jgi:hypothetical protein
MPQFFSTEHTRVLEEAIRELETDPNEYIGARYMPAVDVPASMVYVDIWESRGGLVKEHTLGTDPQSAPKRQFRTMSFSSGAYKEFIRFNEADILRLRELGLNDQSKRGIRQHLNENVLTLNNRIESRIELLRWQAMLNGYFVYDGKVVDFGVPALNQVAPAVPWGESAGGSFTTAIPEADPLRDLLWWLTGGYAPFRKYKVTRIVMNPNTERMFLENPKVRALIGPRFAAADFAGLTLKNVAAFLMPGLPDIEIYNGWYQSESEDPITGKITVGDAVYFIPDGKIFFEVKLPGGANTVGDFQMSLNLSNGSIDNPATGKFVIVKEHIEDKPENPYIDVIGGVYGGPRLKRGFDLLSATVI